MKILLTGGSGLVGRNILEHRAAHDHEILAPTHGELDLLDRYEVEAYLKLHRPSMIIHAAGWVGGIQANIAAPVRFLLDNLDMARNLIGLAYEVGVPQLINLGSSCMYPRNAPNPLQEDMILQGELEPTNEGYALAKIAAARLCRYVSMESPTFRYKTFIPCNLYGRFDKFDPRYSHMIPAIIHKLYQAKENGRNTVEIWGDGSARREFMYASDFADFVWSMLDRFDELPPEINVGCGEDHTVNEFYQTAAEVVGYCGNFSHDPSKPAGMARKQVDIGRANSLGWCAKISLREGIAKTYEYYLEMLEKGDFK